MINGFTIKELAEVVEGELYGQFNTSKYVNDFEFAASELKKKNRDHHLCFISISKERWNKENRVKANWPDGNTTLLSLPTYNGAVITENPIRKLKDIVPQIIVENSFTTIRKIAQAARHKMTNPVIAVTGSVGKSSTRLMLEHLLKGEATYVATRGNHNTQAGVPLYGAKLCKNPDKGIIEISLNALNNRGNQALVIKPDVVIMTSIGAAHLSTLNDTKNVARFKARIFAGLKKGGLAVINKDIDKEEQQILIHEAKKRTDRIKFYSCHDQTADLYLKSCEVRKYESVITITYAGKDYTFTMQLPSKGMIENSLAALLVLIEEGYEIEKLLSKLHYFTSLDCILQLKQVYTMDNRRIDIIDDTHNAAIPSMMNAIQTFKEKVPFYKGNKLLVLGQVADLGKQSTSLHETLVPYIESSGATHVFGHGKYMRRVIRKLPNKIVGGWFTQVSDLVRHLSLYCPDDSLILLKGSISGSDFYQSRYLLPAQLKCSKSVLQDPSPAQIAEQIQPVLGAVLFNKVNNQEVSSFGYRNSQAIEGLGPLILLYLILRRGIKERNISRLQKWPTNRGETVRGKPFKTGIFLSDRELLEELIKTQHPSATFELAYRYFGNRNRAMQAITTFVTQHKLSLSSALNLTGRYRPKEQQAYFLDDLIILARLFAKVQQDLPEIMNINNRAIKGIVFGQIRYAAICFYSHYIICVTGLRDRRELYNTVYQLMRKVTV